MGMDTNVRTTVTSNHLTEGTKRAVVMAKPVTEIRVMELDMAKLDTDRPDTEIRVMEPDMDKLDTEITVMISQFFSEISV